MATPNLFPDGGYTNTSGCHDITVNPARKIAAGACMGDGIILDIKDPVAPKVIDRVRDTTNFAFWHSATFNNAGTKVVFTDELGGGGAATCNAAIGPNRGANGIYDLSKDRKLTFRSYYKIPRHQFDSENCVAHNGSLIPVKGRDVMVQSWYMGGTSFWDFTDSDNPREIGYFERGPNGGPAGGGGGTWSSYYYNGHVYSSDLGKGFDVLKITDARPEQGRHGEDGPAERADPADLPGEVAGWPHQRGDEVARTGWSGPPCRPAHRHGVAGMPCANPSRRTADRFASSAGRGILWSACLSPPSPAAPSSSGWSPPP